MTQSDVLNYLIRKGPGRTELELARAIYGGNAYQQRVNQDCYMMAILGEVERRGAGGRGDPVLAGSCVRNLMIARHPLGGIVK